MIGPLVAVALALRALAPAAALPAATASPEKEVRAALARYVELTRTMDHAALAAMFAPDGEIVNPGQDPIRGPEAIEAFLRQFAGYHVITNEMTPKRTSVRGDQATQSGLYRQVVRTPDDQTLTVTGNFELAWIRGADRVWRFRRAETTPRP